MFPAGRDLLIRFAARRCVPKKKRSAERQESHILLKDTILLSRDWLTRACFSGVLQQRAMAKAALEELTRTWTDVEHPVPQKFHGTMKGKNAIVVQRVELETGTTISFSKEEGGSIAISGQQQSCADAWKLMQFFKAKLPGVLTKLRAGAVKAGDLQTIPAFEGSLDAELVWPIALEEALIMFKKEMRIF